MPFPHDSSRARYRAFVDAYKHGRLDVPKPDVPDGVEPEASDAPRAEAPRARRRWPTLPTHARTYVRWLWPHRYRLGSVLALALLAATLQMAEPLFLRFIVDHVLMNPALDLRGRVARLNMAGAVFVSVIVAGKLVEVLNNYRQRLVNIRLMLALRREMFERLLHLPLPALWEMKTGGILSRLTGDVDTTTGLLQMAVLAPTVSAVRLTVAISMLVILNWRLAIVAMLIIPGVMLLSFAAARRVRPIYRSIRSDLEGIDGRVGETFSGIRVVRAFRREAWELRGYMIKRHAVLRKELFAQRRELVVWTTWGLLVALVNLAIIWYGSYLNIIGSATLGDIIAVQWYALQLLNPVWQLVNSFADIQRSAASMDRVFHVLGMPPDKPDRPDAREAPTLVEEIAFEGVEFEYRPGQPVVRDFDVVVPGGSVVALVGRSGAGKTTITDLVARFHDPTRGRILVNGHDLRSLRLHSYRDRLALVQQDVFLFDGTIAENIAYGARVATAAEIQAAAERANAHEFIARMPHQYETIIGERGVKLSGGQRQRLAIARAILKSPQILVLDEATSNLDTESEQLIQASMSSLFAGRTTFVIAHRLSTISRADLILLIEDGRILERGTHDELMQRGGVYREMVLRQTHAQMQSVDEAWAWREPPADDVEAVPVSEAEGVGR